jgi:hypothetical protein
MARRSKRKAQGPTRVSARKQAAILKDASIYGQDYGILPSGTLDNRHVFVSHPHETFRLFVFLSSPSYFAFHLFDISNHFCVFCLVAVATLPASHTNSLSLSLYNIID